MSKIGIFYGSSTGYTADVATRIAEALGVDTTEVFDVAKVAPSKLGDYDVLLLGSSTWGVGDLQDDWADFIEGASALDLKGKKIGLFGCGDESMSDSFCGALGVLYDRMKDTGAEMIAPFNADGYDFNESGAERDGKFVGLVLDEINHSDLTDGKIKAWCELVKSQI